MVEQCYSVDENGMCSDFVFNLRKDQEFPLSIEQFDEKTLVLKGMPAMLEHIDPKELIEILIKEFEYKNRSH